MIKDPWALKIGHHIFAQTPSFIFFKLSKLIVYYLNVNGFKCLIYGTLWTSKIFFITNSFYFQKIKN